MKYLYLLLSLLVISYLSSSQIYKGHMAEKHIGDANTIRYKEYTNVPVYISFKENFNLNPEDAIEYSKKFVNDNTDFKLQSIQKHNDQISTKKYIQTLNGYPIEFTTWNIHIKGNRVLSINGEILDNPNCPTSFEISEEMALQNALNYFKAEEYMWEDENEELILKQFEEDIKATYYPKGEKIIVPDKIDFKNSTLKSAYKFNVFSKKPFDRKMIYVDAQTGEVLFDLALIHVSNEIGSANTQYSGIKPISTEYTGTEYILKDNTRGLGIRTLNCSNETNYGTAIEFTDDNNVWNNINPQLDEYATDAHFATISTYDYFFNTHNRNSINNNGHKLWSYVHFNLINYGYSTNVNAFWNGQWMTYGDGSASRNITPLTTIDICGHEITHGLTQYSAGLIYQYEAGALNESFSDIFGCAIEFKATPENADWLIGEDMGLVIRSLKNPKSYNKPDTYKGEYWVFGSSDHGGVHVNSGPMNYWFYLVSEGGSGTNDFNYEYNVSGIGINKAEKIAYKVLTQYLTRNSDYSDAHFYSMIAAADIYGECSPEVKTVGDAFYAIGVTEEPYSNGVKAKFTSINSENCSAPFEVQFINQSYNSSDFIWDFGDGNTSTLINPKHTYQNIGNYTVSLIVNANICGSDNTSITDYVKINENLPCFTIMNFVDSIGIESCNGIIYGPGGNDGYYNEHINSVFTIHSSGASQIVLDIIHLNIAPLEYGIGCNENFIAFFDGNSTNAPLINNTHYCNDTDIPTSISSTGEYITVLCYNDLNNVLSNNIFKLKYQCAGENHPPIPHFYVDKTSSCDKIINFYDNTIGNVTLREWDFGDNNTSNELNPIHQYATSGVYTIKLTTYNNFGSRTITKEKYITINIPDIPSINDIIACSNFDFTINLDLNGEINWYNTISDITPIYSGNEWIHPPIEQEKVYYIERILNKSIINVGPTNAETHGDFHYFNSSEFYLIFDAYIPLKLKSVMVNSLNSDTKIIAITSNSNDIVAMESIYIPAGISRIDLNFDIPIGKNYKLKCPEISYLFRSDVSAGIQFPYEIENLISIKASSIEGYYYFFYDWQIETDSCIPAFTEVRLIPTVCNNVDDMEILNRINIFPNPGNNIFEISGIEKDIQYSIKINDISGKIIIPNQTIVNDIIDLNGFSDGIYFVCISNMKHNKVIKLIKQ